MITMKRTSLSFLIHLSPFVHYTQLLLLYLQQPSIPPGQKWPATGLNPNLTEVNGKVTIWTKAHQR